MISSCSLAGPAGGWVGQCLEGKEAGSHTALQPIHPEHRALHANYTHTHTNACKRVECSRAAFQIPLTIVKNPNTPKKKKLLWKRFEKTAQIWLKGCDAFMSRFFKFRFKRYIANVSWKDFFAFTRTCKRPRSHDQLTSSENGASCLDAKSSKRKIEEPLSTANDMKMQIYTRH